ncbi:MAG: hypothetical protein KatS3mg108_3491 [Isosphaeraceae bacterium]|jgi:chemotaxis-related protein WspD|nr:MAG: hypothetical protein KatS3mg108_3491 [Isosphaeraceae bacterium]
MTLDERVETDKRLAAAARRFFDRPPPPDYLQEWSERLANRERSEILSQRSLILFRLSSELLALETRWLVEVSPPRPIHAIPHRTSGVLLGLVNIRGQLRLCASLHALLGVESRELPNASLAPSPEVVDPSSRMLIVLIQNDHWVFPVEEVVGIVRPADSELREVPATFGKASSFSRAVFSHFDQTAGYLDEIRLSAALRSACT